MRLSLTIQYLSYDQILPLKLTSHKHNLHETHKVKHKKSAKPKDTWNQGDPSFRTPTLVQSPLELFHPCSLLEWPHPTVKIKRY